MHASSKLILGLSAAVILAACSTTAAQQARSPRAEAELAEALAGRVAGPPVRCIPTYRADDMKIIDDSTILFKDGSTIYLHTPPGEEHRQGRAGTPRPYDDHIVHLCISVRGRRIFLNSMRAHQAGP